MPDAAVFKTDGSQEVEEEEHEEDEERNRQRDDESKFINMRRLYELSLGQRDAFWVIILSEDHNGTHYFGRD